jgi:DNA-directed RNA polymerase specialized sigma24 family protein
MGAFLEVIEDLLHSVYDKRHRVYAGGSGIVEEVEFFNHCWDLLEGDLAGRGAMLQKVYNQLERWAGDSDDRGLRSYLWKIFDNELKQMIYKLGDTGRRTRFKQLERLLPGVAEKQPDSARDRLWRRRGTSFTQTVSGEELARIAEGLDPPRQLYAKKRESIRGPRVSDCEMETFLAELFARVDGAVRQADLQSLLVSLYSLQGSHQVSWDALEESGMESAGSQVGQSSGMSSTFAEPEINYCYACEYQDIAEAIIAAMDEPLLRLYGYLYIGEWSQTEVADRLGVSNATVSGLKKRLQELFARHLEDLTSEEAFGVLQLVSAAVTRRLPPE